MVFKGMIKVGEVCWIWELFEIMFGFFIVCRNLLVEMVSVMKDVVKNVLIVDLVVFKEMIGVENLMVKGYVEVDYDCY